MKLKDIPLGTNVHCVELKPLKGAQLARSAGTSARLIAKEGIYATLRLQSGETRKVLWECRATLGVVSNQENNLKSLGKAGAKRWRGVRPTVRGVAMNPVDHPHGGGEEELQVEDIHLRLGEFLLKVTRLEKIKELTI